MAALWRRRNREVGFPSGDPLAVLYAKAVRKFAAWLLRNEGLENRLQQAESILNRQARKYGSDGGPTASARADVAQILERMGRFSEARLLREKVLSDYRRHYGETHEWTLDAEFWVAPDFAKDGLPTGARELGDHVYESRVHAFGPDHKETLSVKRFWTISTSRIATRREGFGQPTL